MTASHWRSYRQLGINNYHKMIACVMQDDKLFSGSIRENICGFAVLMKAFLGTDPYQCILCKGRLRFAGAMAGEHATKMLSDRLHKMAKKRWLQALALDECT